MKRLILLTTIICVYFQAYAQEYQLAEIEELANSFFNKESHSNYRNGGIEKQIASIDSVIRDSTNYMYVVNAKDSAGWVILPNEKRYPITIAHADRDNFVYDTDMLPPALICILNNHMNAIDSIRSNRMQTSNSTRNHSRSSTDTITPTFMSNIKWNQSLNNDGDSADCDKVYNKFCPTVNKDTCEDKEGNLHKTCNRKLAGCGAIAMAQLMKYWQWPDYATISNTTYYYDWDNIPNEIHNNTDMYKIDEVARLIENCRTAAKSVGGCYWTAAEISKIHDAMIDVFGYHSNLVRPKLENVDISSMIINEINVQRPVIVQAYGDSLLKEAHTFIVDGYKIIKNVNDTTKKETSYHVNFGWGWSNYAYYDLSFNGYDRLQTYLVELYPMCNHRDNNVSLDNTFTIAADDNRTYYSTNNIAICSNSNSIIVNSGGHLLVKAGNEVRLKQGFHAKAGSEVHITINDTLCNSPQAVNSLQYIASRSTSAPTDDTEPTDEVATSSSLENIASEIIHSTSIYTISGQLLQTQMGGQYNTSQLPEGLYILQHHMSDGSVRSEKFAITK